MLRLNRKSIFARKNKYESIELSMEKGLLKTIETTVREQWESPALTDFHGPTMTYKDAARRIVKLHLLFEEAGIKKGDKIALCAKNSSHWGVAFIATISYGAIAVPILNEFKPENIQHLVNHSEAKLLFVGDDVWQGLDYDAMKDIIGFIRMEDYSLRESRSKKLTKARENLNRIFGERYPERFEPADFTLRDEDEAELAIINYTSGTTAGPKGVMIPMRALKGNLDFCIEHYGAKAGRRIVAMLPLAHMYGLSIEYIFAFAVGTRVYFLTKSPSPKIIAEAMAEVKPFLIITVPLVIEKIIQKKVLPALDRPILNILKHMPIVNDAIYKKVYKQVRGALGGEFVELIVGGASLNKEVETFLRRIGFEYTVGYGMTEFAPLLCYAHWDEYVPGSCGKAVTGMEMKIDSPSPKDTVGEILARGRNQFLGYYKNDTATRQFIDPEGWCHTGDLGLMDEAGNIYIKGRSKNLILGASGQNIYPEEIEDKILSLTCVSEVLVVEKESKITALVFPDYEEIRNEGIAESQTAQTVTDRVMSINAQLETFCQIRAVKIMNEEFEKTPKRSIKRYMYQ